MFDSDFIGIVTLVASRAPIRLTTLGSRHSLQIPQHPVGLVDVEGIEIKITAIRARSFVVREFVIVKVFQEFLISPRTAAILG